MSRIRSVTQSPRISKTLQSNGQGCSSDQHPWFSFRYMTANKSHSLEFLDSISASDRAITLSNLFCRLQEISHEPWTHWMQQPKKTGLETLDFDQLSFLPSSDARITKDTKIFVFRFDTYKGSGKGRILGFKSSPCSVLHIIGYDFDFSAYKH